MKLTALEPSPPGLDTMMLALPAAEIKLAGTSAVTCVALKNVVASGVPFHCTVAPERKLVPVTVSVKAGLPALAEFGASDVMAGRAGVMGWLKIANATGPPPAAKGEPGKGVRAPLLELIACAETLSVSRLG